MNIFANVGIGAVGDLGETARVLGDVLGGLAFVQDDHGRYDEYPAYIVEHDGLRYALLGIPAPEDDLREVPEDGFALMVEPALPQVGREMVDVSDELILKIRGDGRLQCWSLE